MKVYVVVQEDVGIHGVFATFEAAEIEVGRLWKDTISSQPELAKYNWNLFFTIEEEELL